MSRLDEQIKRPPKDLCDRDQWVVWRHESRASKTTKIPYTASTGRQAKVDRPSAWSSFSTAVRACKEGDFSGIGFVLTQEDPFTGVDLDNALDDLGQIKPWAREILDQLPSRAYVEISPSRRGLHVFVRAKKPGPRCKASRGDGAIEIYDRRRYFTITGVMLSERQVEIVEAQQQVEKIYRQLFPESASTAPAGDTADQQLLDRAFASKSGAQIRSLWNGQKEGYASASEADLALCSHLWFWTEGDPARVDRLFRLSGLMRRKWDRQDYRESTLARASQGQSRRSSVELKPQQGDTMPLWTLDPLDAPQKPNTHKANAWRFAKLHGKTVRHVSALEFLVFDGKRWVFSEKEAQRLAARVSRYICEEAAEISRAAASTDDKEKRAILQRKAERLSSWARASEQGNAIRETLNLAAPYLQLDPDDLDRHPFLLNVRNGTLDLKTGRRRPHSQKDLLTRLAPVDHRPEAKAPRWDAFIREIMGGNENLIRYLQTALGYCLTGSVREQALFFAYGQGQNGKSTLLDALRDTLGSDYVTRAAPDLLMAAKYSQPHSADTADLRGARMVISQEVAHRRGFDEQKMKELTGERYLKARKLYGNWFEFQATFKIWLAANHLPQVRDNSLAFWRRIHLIPFTQTIAKPDRSFGAKLAAEKSGILNWLLEGCRRYLDHGLDLPQEIRNVIEGYRLEADSLGRFIAEHCVVESDREVQAKVLWTNYEAYVREMSLPAIKRRHLKAELLSRGFQMPVRRKSGIFYLGLAIK